jgi:hypothetical protein
VGTFGYQAAVGLRDTVGPRPPASVRTPLTGTSSRECDSAVGNLPREAVLGNLTPETMAAVEQWHPATPDRHAYT